MSRPTCQTVKLICYATSCVYIEERMRKTHFTFTGTKDVMKNHVDELQFYPSIPSLMH